MRPANGRKKDEIISWLIIKTQTHLIQLQRTIIVKSSNIDKIILSTNN